MSPHPQTSVSPCGKAFMIQLTPTSVRRSKPFEECHVSHPTFHDSLLIYSTWLSGSLCALTSWLFLKSFFLNFGSNFTEKLQSQNKMFVCSLHPAFLDVNILHNHSTRLKTRKWTLGRYSNLHADFIWMAPAFPPQVLLCPRIQSRKAYHIESSGFLSLLRSVTTSHSCPAFCELPG